MKIKTVYYNIQYTINVYVISYFTLYKLQWLDRLYMVEVREWDYKDPNFSSHHITLLH